jgi:hypothetical protein
MSNTNIKPVCKLIGEDGNVFNIIVKVSQALKKSGLKDQAKEFQDRATQQESYDDVLRLVDKYVEVE